MNFSVVAVVNGNFAIHSEHQDDVPAIVEYFGYVRTLWNAQDVESAMVAIMDENLDVYKRYKEYIHHDAE